MLSSKRRGPAMFFFESMAISRIQAIPSDGAPL
jgi:hypothetical protein